MADKNPNQQTKTNEEEEEKEEKEEEEEEEEEEDSSSEDEPPPKKKSDLDRDTWLSIAEMEHEEDGEENLKPETLARLEKEFDDFLKMLLASAKNPKSKKRRRRLSSLALEEKYDFPEDFEKWNENDIGEIWADAPAKSTKPGWDPAWADEDDFAIVNEGIKYGRRPAIAPFYLPYRKPYPYTPSRRLDRRLHDPKRLIEELDMVEEFLKWVSYIFPDGSSYEGTVWDDFAHGKGVYVAERGLVRYEGEWLQNQMEGHGVVEVDIPDREPVPGSELEAKMREEGKIISRDFMSPEDREWLEMDIEDSYLLADGDYEIPFDENKEWIKLFGQKPEKGRYRYAGQWKEGRMHGCGVYEVNERPIYGKFYFGELLEDSSDCDENISALHAGIAEVAAAKARMFVNKPDGMIREQRGPYSDPQHPYFYEEEDVWMAPGFINQFYEVPDYWKMYVHDVDEERGMWLNSFYKAPLRIPMPAELEHWWDQDGPEFLLVNSGPELDPEDPSELDPEDPSEHDPEDPSRLVNSEQPLILHTKTGRLLNYVDDEKYGIRLFWQPSLEDGEKVDLNKVEYLYPGFDEFYGENESIIKDEGTIESSFNAVENVFKQISDKLEEWSEKTKLTSETKLKLIEKELELIEAELCLEEAAEDMDMELKRKEQEEENKVEMSQQEVEDTSAPIKQDGLNSTEEEDEDEDEDEEDDGAPASFGSVAVDEDSTNNDKGNKRGKSPFAAASLSFASCSLLSTVPFQLQNSFASWKNGVKFPMTKPICPQSCPEDSIAPFETVGSVSFPRMSIHHSSLKAHKSRDQHRICKRSVRLSPLHSLSRLLSNPQVSTGENKSQREQQSCTHNPRQKPFEMDPHHILSLHFPINCPGT